VASAVLQQRRQLLEHRGELRRSLLGSAGSRRFQSAADLSGGHIQRRVLLPNPSRLGSVYRRLQQRDHQPPVDILVARQSFGAALPHLLQQISTSSYVLDESRGGQIPQAARF